MRVLADERLELSDGVRLAVRAWLPEEAGADPVAAIPDAVRYRRSGAVGDAAVEAVQRGSSSGMVDRGSVLGATESLIGHFQDWIRARLELDQGRQT